MLAPNPTRLDADSPPSTRRWRPRRQRLVTMSEAHDQPLLSLLIARQKQTRCSTTRRMNVCRSTPEIGNRRRETGSQGHGVNLASRLENTPTGPANTYRAGQRAASTWSWSDVHPRPPQIPLQCRARLQPGADGALLESWAEHRRHPSDFRHGTMRYAPDQLIDNRMAHSIPMGSAHDVLLCWDESPSRPAVANDLSDLRDKRGIPGRTSSWRASRRLHGRRSASA